MGFYDLSKPERDKLVKTIKESIHLDLKNHNLENILKYASDNDTYIRKNAYLALARLYNEQQDLREVILVIIKNLMKNKEEKVRQTMVYAMGEIGKLDAEPINNLLENALGDDNLKVKNAVIGALKQMGQKNPLFTLEFARKHINDPNPKIRKEMVHGIELRGRTCPEDILPLLKLVQHDPDKEVQKKIIHVLGQISYKEGCLEKVIPTLKKWENQQLAKKALKEILEVHDRYEKFAAKSQEEVKKYIEKFF